ncbi:MAG: hypothetical protein QXO21_00915 [Candidatus Anstonellales archaeon]
MGALTIFDLEIGKTYTFARLINKKRIRRSTFRSILYNLDRLYCRLLELYSEEYEQKVYFFDYFIRLLKSRPRLKLDNFSFTVVNIRRFIDIGDEFKKTWFHFMMHVFKIFQINLK